MKKNFKFYALIWVLMLALFNVIAFVSSGWENHEKYTNAFWTGYIFITLMFVGQLICSAMAFSSDSAKKMFYNISLIRTSYIGLVVSFVIGGLCMLISTLSYWIAVLICSVILAINIITVLKAAVVVSEVGRVDQKIKAKTFFVKSLTVDAEALVKQATSEFAKEECRRVYEIIRYSDPMSNDALAAIEAEISIKFATLTDVVKANNIDEIKNTAREIVILIENRNNKCKLLK